MAWSAAPVLRFGGFPRLGKGALSSAEAVTPSVPASLKRLWRTAF